MAAFVMCLKGNVDRVKRDLDAVGGCAMVHRISGMWSSWGIADSAADVLPGSASLRFEFEKVSQCKNNCNVSMISGKYKGWFEMIGDDGTTNEIKDSTVNLRFQKEITRKDHQGNYTVEGEGGISPLGQFIIKGTLKMNRRAVAASSVTRAVLHRPVGANLQASVWSRDVTAKCRKILQSIRNKDKSLGGFFEKPVDPIAFRIPTYFEVIKEPMDLGTVHQMMEENAIASPQEFSRLVRLVFENAIVFNVDPLNIVHQTAQNLSTIFNRKLQALEKRGGHAPPPTRQQKRTRESTMELKNNKTSKRRRLDFEHQQGRRMRQVINKSNKTTAMPKLAAKKNKQSEYDQKPLTEEDLELLVDAINRVAATDQIPMDIIQIIKKAANISPDEDEVEIDVKLLDNATQKKLFRHPLVLKYAKRQKRSNSTKKQSLAFLSHPANYNQMAHQKKAPQRHAKCDLKGPAGFGMSHHYDDSSIDSQSEEGVIPQPPPRPIASVNIPTETSSHDFKLPEGALVGGDGNDDIADDDSDVAIESLDWKTLATTTNKPECIKSAGSPPDIKDNTHWSIAARQAVTAAKTREHTRQRRAVIQAKAKDEQKRAQLKSTSVLLGLLQAQRREEARLLEEKQQEIVKERLAARSAIEAMIQSTKQTVDLEGQRDLMRYYDQGQERRILEFAQEGDNTPEDGMRMELDIDQDLKVEYERVYADKALGILNWIDA